MPLSLQSYGLLGAARAAVLLLTAALLPLKPVCAQGLQYEVNNGLTREQVSVVQTSNRPKPRVSQGSLSAIQQVGYGNSARAAIEASLRSASFSFQLGEGNISRAAILRSPGSSVAQVQLGDANLSLVTIAGGHSNNVSTGQIGNNLGLALGLIDSQSTQVVYGQAGGSYSGGITIRNAPPGTVITIE